jgi:hypothetical protein
MKSDSLRKSLGLVNKQIEDIRTIAEGAESPFWKAYKAELEKKLRSFNFRLDNFDRFDDERRVIILAQRQFLQFCLSMPEDLASQLERLMSRAEKLREALKNAR